VTEEVVSPEELQRRPDADERVTTPDTRDRDEVKRTMRILGKEADEEATHTTGVPE
jgi:hypothetical protein